ncbi:MAG: response regulator [Planctomycetes bacterium]|nr:response regulator [Planctomycetota bacterium]
MTAMKILLVDDEERFLETTSKLIRMKGHEVRSATSGAAALEMLEEEEADVVILDVKMPGMDGVATLKQMRALHPLMEVIMLTGHGTIDSAFEGMRSGAFDYLKKPCDIGEILGKCQEACDRRRRALARLREAEEREGRGGA